MAKLRREVQLYIVRSLAQFNTPTETAQAVQQEFGIEMTRQKCEAYDPTKRTGQNLSAELKGEFEITRQNFIDNPQHVPLANLTYRLQRMQRVIDGAGKNNILILSTLEQAAKDVGGVFTNRKEITGKNGEALGAVVAPVPLDAYLDAREKVVDEY